MKWRGISLQLQNHAYGRIKKWWIVAMPKRGNQRGRYFSHLGYWYHFANRGHEREISLNLARVIDYLASGARPTKRVQLMLSYFGLMPRPFVPPPE
jgi:ribosomal protein S16